MMKKVILSFVLCLILLAPVLAQSGKSIRIGYIDMEYILQNVSNYAEANNQLELKAQKWRQDLEAKKNEITKLKESLKIEKVLLTRELIEEREEAIVFLESEMVTYQQNRFGPQGDFMIQKDLLVKPIQDQIFIAVQDVAERRKYDFILDKSSDLTILFAKKNFDISDQVIKIISRAEKVDQRTKKQIKADEAKEYREDVEDANPLIAERRKNQTDRQAAIEAKKEEKKAAQAELRAAAETKRLQTIADRTAKKNGTVAQKITLPSANSTQPSKGETDEETKEAQATLDKIKLDKEAARQAILDAKMKDFEMRKKAIDDRKAKTLADREVKKNETAVPKTVSPSSNSPLPASLKTDDNVKEAQEAIEKVKVDKEAARQAIIDAKKKDFEMRQKVIEDKKAKTLADREALKKTKDSIKANTPKK